MSQFTPEINAAKQQLERLRNEEAVAEARYSQLEDRSRQASAAADQRRSTLIASGLDPAEDAQYQELAGQAVSLRQQLGGISAQIARIKNDLVLAQEELNRVQTTAAATQDQGPNTESAGQTTAAATQAQDQGANTQRPNPAPQGITPSGQVQDKPPETTPTNAEVPTGGATDAGTQGRLRTIEETQSTPPSTAAISAASKPGAGAARDDNQQVPATNAANATQAGINRKFGSPLVPRPNVLDNFASYTYTISIYLATPEDYVRLLTQKQRDLAGFQLLIQSGGAPQDSGIIPSANAAQNRDVGDTPPGGPSLSQGRNQEFPLDFYIENLRVTSAVSGKGTQGSHGVVSMEFKIIEPYGITLFERLYRAVQKFVTVGGGGGQGPLNYAAQTYLMVIRFYGYDQNGRLVAPKTIVDPAGVTDRLAISEKLIPFRFQGIKFRVANRLTEYDCTAVCPQHDIAQGQGRGIIPYNIELTGTTVQNLLNGSLQTSEDPSQAPAKADAAPAKVVISGLAEAMNKYQRELAQRGDYTHPDQYEFIIVDPEIRDAKLKPPGQAAKGSWGMIVPADAAQAKDGAKQTANANSKNISATAGVPVVAFLDLLVRNSTYIYDQQTKVRDPATNKELPQGSAVTPAWFKIDVQYTPFKDQYDPKRNDFACKITYQISTYKVSQIKSDYFPEGRFTGTHKKYDYWFTGENTSVLKFEQDFNYLFYLTVNSSQQPREIGSTADYREYEKRVFQANSPQSKQGADGNVNEAGANAADYLYSPGDQARVNLSIVGDPAWIQQGSVWSGVNGPDATDPAQVAFLTDGTINYTSQEVLFELAFNKPADYNLRTGLMDISRRKT